MASPESPLPHQRTNAAIHLIVSIMTLSHWAPPALASFRFFPLQPLSLSNLSAAPLEWKFQAGRAGCLFCSVDSLSFRGLVHKWHRMCLC